MIPPFNLHGLLPPFVGHPADLDDRSPYQSTMEEVVSRFATSDRRREILRGLLDYRAALRAAGMDGYQWLDGSFVEDRGAEPNDVDVVMFHTLSPADTAAFVAARPDLADPRQIKAAFKVDAYYVDLSQPQTWETVTYSVYWYGLFSHQRGTERWKGMVQVPLASADDDAAARALLAGGAP